VAISARVSARIAEVPFDEGEQVTKGDPVADPPVPASLLIRLDSTDLEASLRSSQARRNGLAAQIEVDKARIDGQVASLKGTKASLDEAERDLSRQRELVASGDVSQLAYEQAQRRYDEQSSQYASAQANLEASRRALHVSQFSVDAADAEIERAEDSLSYTTIVSPIDGVVTIVNVEPGELAVTGTMNNPGTVLLEVADLSTMLVVAELDEADVSQVQEGQPAKVRMLAYPDRIFDGTVRSVALSATRLGTKFFKTEVLLETDGEHIYTGLTADAEIEVARHENILTVPSQAVLGRPVEDLPMEIRDDNEYVDQAKTIVTVVFRFVDGKAVVTPVKIGPSDVTHTVILGGLEADAQVVVGPYKALEGLKHDQNLKDERESKDKPDADAGSDDKDEAEGKDADAEEAEPDESETVETEAVEPETVETDETQPSDTEPSQFPE
jgi:HlyD family secretion protein